MPGLLEPIPYISVTDFTTRRQAVEVLAHFKKATNNLDLGYRLGVAVMMSRKTLTGLPTRWADVFPKKEDIANIFLPPDAHVMNTLHYVSFPRDERGEEGRELFRNLQAARDFCGDNLDAIQLDMVWPDFVVVKQLREKWRMAGKKPVDWILQLNTLALEVCHFDPGTVAERLKRYDMAVQYVLLDMSMGTGTVLDPGALDPYLKKLREQLPGLGLAVAGGLGPETMSAVQPLMKYEGLSFDAQRRLRLEENPLGPIDLARTKQYISAAAGMIRKRHKR